MSNEYFTEEIPDRGELHELGLDPNDVEEIRDREELHDMGLDPNEPDYGELAAEGLSGDETDDEDLRDAQDDIEDPNHDVGD
jgi:hypothetical protein